MKKYLVSGIASIVMTALSMALIVLSVQSRVTHIPNGSEHSAVAQTR